MAKTRLSTVNFGLTQAGLATVGYTLYNVDGTVNAARSTSGVHEFGTSTGVYGALISIPENLPVLVMWDTGAGSPRYGSEDNNVQLNSIQSETDQIRLIWNSIKNQGVLLSTLMDKLGLIEKNQGLVKQEIRDAVGDIKLPEQKEIKIPDNSKMEELLTNMSNKVHDPGRYDSVFANIKEIINTSISRMTESVRMMNSESKDRTANIVKELKKVQDVFSKFEALTEKMNKFSDNFSKGDEKELKRIESEIRSDIKKLHNTVVNTISMLERPLVHAGMDDITRTFGRLKNGKA